MTAADAVSLGTWSNLAMLTMFLHLSNFGLGFSCGADSSNTRAWVPTSAERLPLFFAWWAIRFEHSFWIASFSWLFFLVHKRLPYKWVAVVSWRNCPIPAVDPSVSPTQHLVKLAVDPTLDSSALLHVHYAASRDFCWYNLACFFFFREGGYWIFRFFPRLRGIIFQTLLSMLLNEYINTNSDL